MYGIGTDFLFVRMLWFNDFPNAKIQGSFDGDGRGNIPNRIKALPGKFINFVSITT